MITPVTMPPDNRGYANLLPDVEQIEHHQVFFITSWNTFDLKVLTLRNICITVSYYGE